ncbi:MAG: archaemetzincin family Zn-dependent metalloprotease [Desulfobacter sp.]|nr:MAG: archaemetzincin family Zn-dependent metalloprotease [Desulfobacter sp.]
MKKRIGVVPLGEVPELVIKVIAANITAYYKWPADALPMQPVPESAFDGARLKYDAGIVINRLGELDFGDCSKIVAVMSQDLFIPIFNYVYGQAVQGGSLALISLFRLDRNADGSTPAPSLFYERAAKVALHELGHLFNLFHCNENKCVMHFTGGIDDLDKIPFYLCRDCERRLTP